jgi:anti-anti-sigma factor
MLVARSDNNVAVEEREVILLYCIERARKLGCEMTPEEETALADYLRTFRPSLTQILSAVDHVKHEPRAEIIHLIEGARDVVGADGTVRLQEALYLNSLRHDLLAFDDSGAAQDQEKQEIELDVQVVKNVTHVKLRGRLDTHGVDAIETKFTGSIVPGHTNAVVDLSGLSFISSMGLRMFIGVAKALKRDNAKMVLFAPHAMVSEVFASTALAHIIPIVGTEAEALAKIAE